MRLKAACLFLVLIGSVGFLLPVAAQEGYPMTGTWIGEWGPDKTNRNQVTIAMTWDGKKISGLINPGPHSAPIGVATLDSAKWTFQLEVDFKDPTCTVKRFIANGKLDNLGSYKRTVTGTYTYGATKGDFKITRD